MQLDLFAHSRDIMLRNDLLDALKAHDAAAGRRALAALQAEFPADTALGPARHLLDQLDRRATRMAAFSNHTEALQAVEQLAHDTRGAAAAVLGTAHADTWLRPAWRALAGACEGLPYHAQMPDAHCAGLYLRAADPTAAAHWVADIPAWRRIPHPLCWAAEANFYLHGLDHAWPLLAELAWLDATLFESLARRLPAPALHRLIDQYECDFADHPVDYAWFPAWALLAHTELRAVLQGASTPQQPAPERACRLICELLTLERQGRHHEVISLRKRLRAVNDELFQRYMQSRS